MAQATKIESTPTQVSPWDYLRLARFDHSTKHIFIVPGIAIALILRGGDLQDLIVPVILGFIAAIAIASSNYVINEWLDREFDAYHPEKSQRTAVQLPLQVGWVVALYLALLTAGLLIGSFVNFTFFIILVVFALAGVAYNVPPIRTKDRAIVDVLSESINNAIRLALGWAMVDPTTLPPASLVIAFWFGGAFLMNSKRLSEYRDIVATGGAERLGLYRRSFKYYTERRLSVANLVYALSCGFFAAIFLIKYRIEYVLLFPFIIALFGTYYAIALSPDSVARKPEHLFKSRPLMLLSVASGVAFLILTTVNMPFLEWLTEVNYLEVQDVVPGALDLSAGSLPPPS